MLTIGFPAVIVQGVVDPTRAPLIVGEISVVFSIDCGPNKVANAEHLTYALIRSVPLGITGTYTSDGHGRLCALYPAMLIVCDAAG
jgi:hypothetical protein